MGLYLKAALKFFLGNALKNELFIMITFVFIGILMSNFLSKLFFPNFYFIEANRGVT